ncbi:sensitivity to high expression protein she9 [Epicoccum nigrum]|nr:sensitivity to high expression protein she9 [Epicoccum nigrum]
MPPPASKSASSVDRTPEQLLERQERLRREWEEQQRKREEEALRKKQQEEEARRRREEEEEALRKQREAEALQKKQQEEAATRKKQEQEQEVLRKAQQPSQSKLAQPLPPPPPEHAPSQLSAIQETTQSEPAVSQTQEPVIDNVQRVPDEHLPSHQDRQRSNLEKRFTALMDELLPKIAVVTQKVNTYTGTDYSGVEALRREIKEQEKLVKARRLAIDSTKEALDAALEQQAASQKEVVALLERKHSWSSSDLERYMSLIRSEHINDRAVREAKEAVDAAETALEEARSYLEKRERAQYHEEQIWSDTIRRNSTWVTFGLMGVNIFLLLLSLLILEPWRRKRMVREIKTALEAQQATAEAAQLRTTAAYIAANSATELSIAPSVVPEQQAVEVKTLNNEVIEPAVTPAQTATPAVTQPSVDESPTAGTEDPLCVTDEDGLKIGNTIDEIMDPAIDPAVPGAAPLTPVNATASPQETIDIQEEAVVLMSTNDKIWAKLGLWQSTAATIAEDIVSDRPISMRRVDFTTAVLQGAAAGAVIAAAAIAMLLRPN